MTKPLKETVNLPQTDFPIRAGLAQVEPQWLEKWNQNHIYKTYKTNQEQAQKDFILHDGPPYPNGNIHLGHALNKILKDIIIKFKVMTGHKSTYIPGWDCHGLPIETQVLKLLKSEGQEDKKHDIPWFRKKCEEFARNYVETQKADFKRLGIWGEWDTPYLTLNPQYEAGVLAQFGKMAENGLIIRGRKPIHWCCHCETALAEAEIEYADHKSPSIFVKFKVKTPSHALNKILSKKPASFVVWTTTPWTLPSNVALAAHPDLSYQLIETDTEILIGIASETNNWPTQIGLETITQLATIKGKDLEKTVTQHPFIDRDSPVVLADYVTDTDGTGFVHIAPGHGQDDYQVGLKYALPMIMPVDNQGKFTAEVPAELGITGQFVFDANKIIGQTVDQNGNLLKLKFITHSYPHCWRCKNPVIFRATPQWFVKMDTPMAHTHTPLRNTALSEIKATKWFPDWGENRITSMIEGRPDWCISRQRSWGIPIPAFICKHCNHAELTGIFNQNLVEKISKEGTQIWFNQSTENLLPQNAQCSQCGHSEFDKETDILDVWFESGASAGSVLPSITPHRANLYLEGSDQHRGWFQSSLLIGCSTTGKAPYDAVLTHGFLVDEKGRKMSKSLGNVVAPEQIIKDFGADVLRWWVASSDFKNDLAVSQSIIKQCSDSFSKVRNTVRFLLSNLYDFTPNEALQYSELNTLDQWALFELNQLIVKTTQHYENYNFHLVTQGIHHFCAVTLSAMYLDMVKDRLYCDTPTSHHRRSTQTALFEIADTLLRLVAPIIVFSAEEAYTHFNNPNKADSIHFTDFPQPNQIWANPSLGKTFEILLKRREEIYKQIEPLRADKIIKSFLEAKIELSSALEGLDPSEWTSFLIVSEVTLTPTATVPITATKTSLSKCERCWRHLPLKTENLCERCANALS